MIKLGSKIFGSRNDRLLKRYQQFVVAANRLETTFAALKDVDFPKKTIEFKERVAAGASLESVLPEAFAAVREASRRTLGLRHFDVQLLGGVVLHEGKIAEMRTGEGKTLVATLSAYLNALSGHGVHIVTVNEYLAARDTEWNRPIYEFLGLSVGTIKNQQSSQEKQAAYACDITYGTNNEFGFDYLRDNLVQRREDRVQRELHYAIVDEVDSILIDEARTPLIISGSADDNTAIYLKINDIVPKLVRQKEEDGPGDFAVDEKAKQVYLSEEGHEHVENLLAGASLVETGGNLYDSRHISLMHHINAALRAHHLFERDVDYIVNEDEVVIVDEFTGRTMPGRRWSDGLHQAIEAKERVHVRMENQTLASITFQNYFRLYDKLSGMTGTADTEAAEFHQIYGLEVVVVPTHKPMIRDDRADLVYLTKDDKFDAIIEAIRECQSVGQPVLVGTTSIESSEYLSTRLTKLDINHQVLNAKQHAREAEVITQAGRSGTVTIATNMAGRGTDIVLGGWLKTSKDSAEGSDSETQKREWQKRHDAVIAAGGLHIIGTERHESRRIDNQLRGRSGRQGDPGSSRFYLSLEDDLMRIFGNAERTKNLLQKVGMRPGEAIESRLLTRQIERAQRRVENHNFDIRKQLLEYDDVANEQRQVIYRQRSELLEADDVSEIVLGVRHDVIEQLVLEYLPPQAHEEQWDAERLRQILESEFGLTAKIAQWLEKEPSLTPEQIAERINQELDSYYESKLSGLGLPGRERFEKAVMLQQLDIHWREHLAGLDYLRQGIFLRGYAQKNPKQEYKNEAFAMFAELLEKVKRSTTSILCRVQIRDEQSIQDVAPRDVLRNLRFQHASAPTATARAQTGEVAQSETPFVRSQPKVGRNESCPCGSGKKYKHCHGRIEDSNAAA